MASGELIAGVITYMITTIILSYFLITILIAIFSKQKTTNPSPTKIESAFTWSSTICIICFWLRSIFATIYYLIITPLPQYINKYGILLNIGWLFYGIGIWIMLLAFIFRIDYTFKGKYNLQYSPFILKILYIMVCILFLLIMATGIVNTAGEFAAVYIGYSVLIFHFIFSCLLSYLLFNKIFIMMRLRLNEQIQQSDVNDNIDHDIQNQGTSEVVIKLNDIKSTTRFALLMFIGIISTYIASVLIFLDVEYLWSTHEFLMTYSAIFLAIDMIVNANSVYLLFKFNNKKYYLVCKLCHGLCQNCCIQCIYQTQKNGNNKSKQECENLILGQDKELGDDALL